MGCVLKMQRLTINKIFIILAKAIMAHNQLQKIVMCHISATTAFVVGNNFFPGFYGWFIPGIIVGIYIIYWMNKLNKKTCI